MPEFGKHECQTKKLFIFHFALPSNFQQNKLCELCMKNETPVACSAIFKQRLFIFHTALPLKFPMGWLPSLPPWLLSLPSFSLHTQLFHEGIVSRTSNRPNLQRDPKTWREKWMNHENRGRGDWLEPKKNARWKRCVEIRPPVLWTVQHWTARTLFSAKQELFIFHHALPLTFHFQQCELMLRDGKMLWH